LSRTLRASLEKRFAQCGLTLHPDKTKVVYCKDDDRRGDYPDQRFDFLGYTFRLRLSRRWKGFGVSFSPAAGSKALIDPANCPTLGAPSTQQQDAG
jgi:RNA-directed DNA polymerase